MTNILTVDDSRAMRLIISRQVRELGFEVHEAEDGEQGLRKLDAQKVDLILLDCTMPVLDGPGMLQRLRQSGNSTPVIMLTSESKRSVVSGAMRLGIDDYILKPFKPEELRNKILSVLQKNEPAGESSGSPKPAPDAQQFVDVLVVDDMENVQKRLRVLLHPHLTLHGAPSAQAAVEMCRERAYRVILLDVDIPDVQSATLAGQLRLLQPHAAVLALALRTTKEQVAELKKQGFDDVLLKPFTLDGIEDFTLQFFDNQEVLASDDNLLCLKPFVGRPERMERYCQRLTQLVPPVLLKMASACFETLIVDVSKVPMLVEKFPKVLATLAKQAEAVGLTLAVVGPPGIERTLGDWDETKDVPCFTSVEEARAAQG